MTDPLVAQMRGLMEEVRTLRREVRHLMLFAEATARGQVGPESDMTDQTIRFVPRLWKGKSYKGALMSRTDPDFLFEYARALASMAADDKASGALFNGRPKWVYGATDAGRARRWAYRLQTGWTPPVTVPSIRAETGFGKMRAFGLDLPDELPVVKDERIKALNFDDPFE